MSQVKNTEERFWEGVCQLGSLILFNLLGRYVALDPFKGHLGCQMQHRPASTFEAAPRLYNEKTKKAEYAFFEGTSLKFLQTTAKMLEKERFEKQDYVFKEGEMGFSMYFICSGSIVISKGSDISDVEILSRGNHCGDSAVFGFSRRSTSAIAREHTECLVLKNRVFQAILERFPEEKEYFAKRADHKKKELRASPLHAAKEVDILGKAWGVKNCPCLTNGLAENARGRQGLDLSFSIALVYTVSLLASVFG